MQQLHVEKMLFALLYAIAIEMLAKKKETESAIIRSKDGLQENKRHQRYNDLCATTVFYDTTENTKISIACF